MSALIARKKKKASSEKGYHHGDLRSALVSEGRKMLEESGIGALSLREAARRLDVSQAAPSYHFGDKSGLLAAIAARGFDDLKDARLKALETTDDKAEAVRLLCDTYVTFALKNSGVFRLMFGEEISRSSYEELTTAAKGSFKVFADTLQHYCTSLGLNATETDLVTMTTWSAEHGLAQLLLSKQIPLSLKPVSEPALRKMVWEVLLVGVASRIGKTGNPV